MQVDLNKVNVNKLITVITDASFCDKLKVAGWAAWAVCDKQRVQCSGFVLTPVNNSTEAEYCALVMGAHLAIQAFRPGERSTLLLQSDSTGALAAMGKGVAYGTPKLRWAFDQLTALKVQCPKLFWRYRHVKGHQNSNLGSRFYVNNWADAEAKKELERVREIKRRQQNSR